MDIQGATRLSKKALHRIYEKYLRKRISIRDVYRIAHTITVKYRKRRRTYWIIIRAGFTRLVNVRFRR